MAESGSEAARIVGSRVKKLRLELGISQMDLGELAGMHFTNVGKLERGETNPTLRVLVSVADALRIDVAELVGGIGAGQLPARAVRLTAAQKLAERTTQGRRR